MDRPHRGPAGPARAGGAPVTANLPPPLRPPETRRSSRRGTCSCRSATRRRCAAPRWASGGARSSRSWGRADRASPPCCTAWRASWSPTQGEVWFGGQRLDTLSDDRRSALRRDRFGFVFQSGQLVPELTAEENVALPLLLSGTRRGPAMTAARKWFGTLGLDGLEHRRSGELSGGQAQRVALARGLVAGPEVLFADEPTGSLDSVSGELVMDLLTAAAREHGTTVVLVTHDARVAAYADREVVVRDGKVSTLTGAKP